MAKKVGDIRDDVMDRQGEMVNHMAEEIGALKKEVDANKEGHRNEVEAMKEEHRIEIESLQQEIIAMREEQKA